MARRDAIQVEGRVVETLPPLLFRVELANGHRLLAHVPARLRVAARSVAAGDTVRVEVSPFDLTTGRLAI